MIIYFNITFTHERGCPQATVYLQNVQCDTFLSELVYRVEKDIKGCMGLVFNDNGHLNKNWVSSLIEEI